MAGGAPQVVPLDRAAASGRERACAPAAGGHPHGQWLCDGSWSDNPPSSPLCRPAGRLLPWQPRSTTRGLPSCTGSCESALGWSHPLPHAIPCKGAPRVNLDPSFHLRSPEPTRQPIYRLFGVCSFSVGFLRDFICY